MGAQRILIAGIGNIFLGDDAFGSEVARKLMRRELPEDVRVVDFGIRGLELTFALTDDGYDIAILIDAAPRGEKPGTLYVLEPDSADAQADDADPHALMIDTHNMDPAKVLRAAWAMGGGGGGVRRVMMVGCEPKVPESVEEFEMTMSAPVRAAVDEAIPLIESLLHRVLREKREVAEQRPAPPLREAAPE